MYFIQRSICIVIECVGDDSVSFWTQLSFSTDDL